MNMTEYEYVNMNKGLNIKQRTLTDPSFSKRREKVVGDLKCLRSIDHQSFAQP